MTTRIGLVSGGGTGIGRAIAIDLASIGVKVVVFGRTKNTLEETVKIITDNEGEADYFVGDIRNIASVAALGYFIQEKYGQVDILVNNAGIDVVGPFNDLSIEKWNNLVSTNLSGPYLLCREFIPQMISRSNGIIINISSVLGIKGIANFSGYSATKFGLNGFSEALCDELSPFGIKVYCICPSRTATDMQVRLGGQKVSSLSMPPEEISLVVKKIVSKQNSFPSLIVVNRRSIKLIVYDLQQLLCSLRRKVLNYFVK